MNMMQGITVRAGAGVLALVLTAPTAGWQSARAAALTRELAAIDLWTATAAKAARRGQRSIGGLNRSETLL